MKEDLLMMGEGINPHLLVCSYVYYVMLALVINCIFTYSTYYICTVSDSEYIMVFILYVYAVHTYLLHSCMV